MSNDATARRKDAHLDLCASEEVAPGENSTLLECVRLVHCAMPELAWGDVSLATPFLGKRLKAPILVTGMTGGTERAGKVNEELAQAAQEHQVAFGVGSQRAMAEKAELKKTFSVRHVAPTAVVLGNLGLQQATRLGLDGVRRLVDAIAADGLAIHLNPGQELTQPEGDRDFRGGYDTIAGLAKAFGERLLVKETGCGISPEVARRLVDCGVKSLDVSGLGGTSWVRVEELRASGPAREVGAQFASWGIPTAAAVATVRRAVGPGVTLVASGGLRNGLDVARALALGADVGGMALPLFRAQQKGGAAAVSEALQVVITGLTQALLLTGSRSAAELRVKPRVIVGDLKTWVDAV